MSVATYVFMVPDLGEGLVEATVLDWFVREGDAVERNAPLVELDSTKSTVEIPSPVTGIVTALHAEAGETIGVGKPLVTFETAEQAGIVGTVPAQEPPRRRVRLRRPGS